VTPERKNNKNRMEEAYRLRTCKAEQLFRKGKETFFPDFGSGKRTVSPGSFSGAFAFHT
jgi:hypothetical protein